MSQPFGIITGITYKIVIQDLKMIPKRIIAVLGDVITITSS